MLPKFLLADNSQESLGKLYVVHTQYPRFILEGNDEDFFEEQEIYWIDDAVFDEDEVENLKALAEEFLEAELDNQEELYDNMVDED